MKKTNQYLQSMKRLFKIIFVLSILLYSCRFVNPIMISMENDKPSKSEGSGSNGKLINGKRLPNKGDNFKATSYLFTALGRNGVTDNLRDLVLESYDSLYKKYPKQNYKYGETGWVNGGKFWPHYTHQNGLVVDFMVPVLNKKKEPTHMRTNVFNRWGYALEFDKNASTKKYIIDFESMAIHLAMIQELAPKHHLKIKRIIFTTEFVPLLLATETGKKLSKITFVQKENWLRHDDHYHTEFEVIP